MLQIASNYIVPPFNEIPQVSCVHFSNLHLPGWRSCLILRSTGQIAECQRVWLALAHCFGHSFPEFFEFFENQCVLLNSTAIGGVKADDERYHRIMWTKHNPLALMFFRWYALSDLIQNKRQDNVGQFMTMNSAWRAQPLRCSFCVSQVLKLDSSACSCEVPAGFDGCGKGGRNYSPIIARLHIITSIKIMKHRHYDSQIAVPLKHALPRPKSAALRLAPQLPHLVWFCQMPSEPEANSDTTVRATTSVERFWNGLHTVLHRR